MKLDTLFEARYDPNKPKRVTVLDKLQNIIDEHENGRSYFVYFSDSKEFTPNMTNSAVQLGVFAYTLPSLIKYIQYVPDSDKPFIHILKKGEDVDWKRTWLMQPDPEERDEDEVRDFKSQARERGSHISNVMYELGYELGAEHADEVTTDRNLWEVICEPDLNGTRISKEEIYKILSKSGYDLVRDTGGSILLSPAHSDKLSIWWWLKPVNLELVETIKNGMLKGASERAEAVELFNKTPSLNDLSMAISKIERQPRYAENKDYVRNVERAYTRFIASLDPDDSDFRLSNTITSGMKLFKPKYGSPLWNTLEPYLKEHLNTAMWYAKSINMRLPRKFEALCKSKYEPVKQGLLARLPVGANTASATTEWDVYTRHFNIA